jgi:threonine synthase
MSPFASQTRCPICGEPGIIPSQLAPIINVSLKNNIYKRYFKDYIVDAINKDNFLRLSQDIGHTDIILNKNLQKWTGVNNLYLKEEYSNKSGSFKDRGTFMAIALLQRKNNYNPFILGTVSTGNMAISTVYMINHINTSTGSHLKSFVVIDKDTRNDKIMEIEKAAGRTGTTIFLVNGEYYKFHKEVYKACSRLRENNVSAYAQLTDDVFRISGYSTLFGEVIEQINEPDVIILPVASGALFRVAVFALESLYKNKYIKKMPHVVLVQEKGADPIVQSFNNNYSSIKNRVIKKDNSKDGLIASGIDVNFSHSGLPTLDILKENYHKCISVTSKEIKNAYDELERENIFPEEASAAALAAALKLRKHSYIKNNMKVICILTGGNIKKRQIKDTGNNSKRIFCNIKDLEKVIIKTFNNG